MQNIYTGENFLNYYLHNGNYILEFDGGWIIDVPENEHKIVNRKYWETQENIDKALMQGKTDPTKYYIQDDFGSRGLDNGDFEFVFSDDDGYFTFDSYDADWVNELLDAYDTIENCDDLSDEYTRYITEYSDYISLAEQIKENDYDDLKIKD